MFKKIKNVLTKDNAGIVIWDRTEDQNALERDIVYRVPNRKIEISEVKKIGVRDFERAIIFQSGKNFGMLEGGIYELEKAHRNDTTTIVWVDMGIFGLKFGIAHGSANIFTKDDFNLGMFGEMKLKVQDPQSFINKVVTFQQIFTSESIKEFINSSLTTSLRDVVNQFTLFEFIREARRSDTKGDFEAVISREFRTYGIELITFDIINTVVPEDQKERYEEILKQLLTEGKEKSEEIVKLKESIKDLKDKQIETEDEWALGNINDETYNERSERTKQLLEARAKRLEDLQAEHKKMVGR